MNQGISKKEAVKIAQTYINQFNEGMNTKDGEDLLVANPTAINDYAGYTKAINNYGATLRESAIKSLNPAPAPTTQIDDFDIVDGDEEDYSNTVLTSFDEMFKKEDPFDQTFIINESLPNPQIDTASSELDMKEQFDNLDLNGLEQVANGALIEDVAKAAEQEIEETNTKTEEKAKQYVLKQGKKAAYVDTVILCLIAQLSIFGLLIIVLLIIK
ncbi:MAG: hypothetical protein IJ565_06615 [Bacilli bacterium]|nr:hypothetical protein [Bacilli bacterium]